uniref:Uncharacterized protein n=1 Tax=Rhizophora mucronata TaxID=61149 RepID=A0A2P2N2J9_RHIMU
MNVYKFNLSIKWPFWLRPIIFNYLGNFTNYVCELKYSFN